MHLHRKYHRLRFVVDGTCTCTYIKERAKTTLKKVFVHRCMLCYLRTYMYQGDSSMSLSSPPPYNGDASMTGNARTVLLVCFYECALCYISIYFHPDVWHCIDISRIDAIHINLKSDYLTNQTGNQT